MSATPTADRPITDPNWLRGHLAEERKRTELLGEMRELLFGIQDGLTSVVVIVSAVAAATGDRFPVVVAGVSATLAGMFAMAVGEYTGSKAVLEIQKHEVAEEKEEVDDRREEAIAEVAYMLETDGLSAESARRVAEEIGTSPSALLKTMVEKEHGISTEIGAPPLQGAIVMGLAFGAGSILPLIPYLFLPVATALVPSLGLSGIGVFVLGVVKSRWTKKNPLASGLELVLLTAGAGVAGYVFGSVLPGLFGVRPVG